jgi:hypothetical protein
MENISGILEKYMIRKKVSKRKGWTILMVGVNGQIKTIKFLRARIFIGVIICIIAVLSTIVMGQLYFKVVQENKKLFEEVAIRHAIYGDKSIIRMPCRMIPENEFQITTKPDINNFGNYRLIFSEPYQFKQRFYYTLSDSLDVIPVAPKEMESTIRYHQQVSATDIKLIINKNDDRIGFSFILRNIANARNAISGTTFVVLKNENDAVAYPSIKLRNGRPVNFRKGRPFYVARFKTVRHRIQDVEHIGDFTEATILVYSKHGQRLVSKTIPIHIEL